MRIKTQRMMLQALAGVLLIVGIAFPVWTISEPSPTTIPKSNQTKNYTAKTLFVGPSVEHLEPLLAKRLQAPLDPPKAVPAKKTAQTSSLQWPSTTLKSILYSPGFSLTTFTSGDQTISCSEGDTVQGVVIETIHADNVEVAFRGQRKTLRPGENTRDAPNQ